MKVLPMAMRSAALALTIATVGAAAAMDTEPTTAPPDLTAIRASIKAKDWPMAIAALEPLVKSMPNADVYNLYAYALRNTGDTEAALTYYGKALEINPRHRGALEYRGQLYLKLGDIDKARADLDTLIRLCPGGCDERSELEAALMVAPEP